MLVFSLPVFTMLDSLKGLDCYRETVTSFKMLIQQWVDLLNNNRYKLFLNTLLNFKSVLVGAVSRIIPVVFACLCKKACSLFLFVKNTCSLFSVTFHLTGLLNCSLILLISRCLKCYCCISVCYLPRYGVWT